MVKHSAKSGKDASYQERLEVVCRFIFLKHAKKKIAREMNRSIRFVRRWTERADDVLLEGSVQSKRKGVVGRRTKFSEKERQKLARQLMGTTQHDLAKKLGICPKTLRKATRFHQIDNPEGSFPYAPKTTPRCTPETQQQAVDFVSLSSLGKAG